MDSSKKNSSLSELVIVYLRDPIQDPRRNFWIARNPCIVDIQGRSFLRGTTHVPNDDRWFSDLRCNIPLDNISKILEFESLVHYEKKMQQFREKLPPE